MGLLSDSFQSEFDSDSDEIRIESTDRIESPGYKENHEKHTTQTHIESVHFL